MPDIPRPLTKRLAELESFLKGEGPRPIPRDDRAFDECIRNCAKQRYRKGRVPVDTGQMRKDY